MHEIHVTRGEGFGAAGSRPITLEQWQQIVVSTPRLEATSAGGKFARLDGCPVVFNEGVIAATSPHGAALKILQGIATALEARLFGEDGTEYGLSTLAEVRRTIEAAFAGLDTSGLTETLARQLATVSGGDPAVPQSQRRDAFEACRALEGAAAKAALAYLVCRAVETGGPPDPLSTCTAAHLLHHDPSRVDGLRRADWVTELQKLARQVEKTPGAYVLRRCHECGATNRIPLFAARDQHPKCGRCKTYLTTPE